MLMNAHPSRSGMSSSGDVDGGSTAWSNTARSRWSLTRPPAEDGAEPAVNARVLTRRKANYASIGDSIALQWRDGVLMTRSTATAAAGAPDRAAAERDRQYRGRRRCFSRTGKPFRWSAGCLIGSRARMLSRRWHHCAATVQRLQGRANADLARLGAAIRRYDAARGGVTLDDEIGLTPAGGAGPWWRAEARAKRDALLRQVRSMCMAEMDLGAAAAEIIALARRRQAETTPPTTRVAQLVDRALQCGPLPERKRLWAILGNPPPE